MMAFDFDRTIYWLRDLGFPFPEDAYVITGSVFGRRNEIKMKLRGMGLGEYELLISPYTTKGNNRDQAAVFKSAMIETNKIDTYYDDSEYQLNIIHAIVGDKCQLKLVTKKGIQDFPRKNLKSL